MSRKLDEAMAKELGYEVKVKRSRMPCEERYFIKNGDTEKPLPEYRTDGNAMLVLDREMRAREYRLELSGAGIICAQYQKFVKGKGLVCYTGYARDTMPEAVALAAYKALTGKEWIEP